MFRRIESINHVSASFTCEISSILNNLVKLKCLIFFFFHSFKLFLFHVSFSMYNYKPNVQILSRNDMSYFFLYQENENYKNYRKYENHDEYDSFNVLCM